MEEFSWGIALLIFLAYCSIDWLWTIYTISIIARRGIRAANVGIGIYLLSAFGVLNYVEDWRYLIPLAIGSWFGTYLSVKHEIYKDKKAKG